MKRPRFTITEVERKNGQIEYLVEDRDGEYDPSSYDDEQEAINEVEALEADTRKS